MACRVDASTSIGSTIDSVTRVLKCRDDSAACARSNVCLHELLPAVFARSSAYTACCDACDKNHSQVALSPAARGVAGLKSKAPADFEMSQ